MSEVTTIGLDLAKDVFQVNGIDETGRLSCADSWDGVRFCHSSRSKHLVSWSLKPAPRTSAAIKRRALRHKPRREFIRKRRSQHLGFDSSSLSTSPFLKLLRPCATSPISEEILPLPNNKTNTTTTTRTCDQLIPMGALLAVEISIEARVGCRSRMKRQP